MLILKSDNRVSFTVRLNLNNPRHREAWDRLRHGAGSYTASIVEALAKKEVHPSGIPDAETLKEIMRQAVSEALSMLPIAGQSLSASDEIGWNGEIDDADFDIADDFMKALGC